ncbi:hypothetical protein KI387_029287, partial [Taxus chinensis]
MTTREIPGGRGGGAIRDTQAQLMEEIRNLRTSLQDVDMSQRRGIKKGDISEEEPYIEMEELDVTLPEERVEYRMIKYIMGVISKPKIEIPMYEITLKPKGLIDWVDVMDKYFEYEEVDDDKK